ncbi:MULTISPECIES: GFA family protein [unclassified Duganella]|uniref:GFA family protein n=1 Tax=unclassified Duganella TaxID=2636909 RepID=UPI000874B94F|nr:MULTISPECIES: GFA family protein [unclassified Duganella]OEZ49438.1 glutathione-dependent formaldehyde-activating enzyme [Duganella sp. HH105]OFA01861.1 glutathione-dependent formaldehyde-activating enzyme [Duganella sp. HH101]
MKYQGSCHCGNVKFEAEGEITSAMSCNCSMCQRKGTLMWFVPRPSMHLLTPDANASTYLFNKHLIKHRFCPTCGISPYSEGVAPNGDAMAAINIRCIEGIDLESIPVTHYDGRAI